jgi:hypothetical protein
MQVFIQPVKRFAGKNANPPEQAKLSAGRAALDVARSGADWYKVRAAIDA